MNARTITFYGYFAKKYGKKHQFAYANWKQLLSGFISRFGPQIRGEIERGEWHLFDGKKKAENSLDAEMFETRNGVLFQEELHFMPKVKANSGGFRAIVGAILIVVGYVLYGMGYGFIGQAFITIGASMLVGAVVEMLTKQPAKDSGLDRDENASSVYNAARNVTTQGGPKPCVYGTLTRASSVVINSDFSTDRNVLSTADTEAKTFFS